VTLDPRTPCLIGVAHHTWHPDEVGPDGAPEPLAMWQEVAQAAAVDAGSPAALERLDQIEVVYCQAWQYDKPAPRLAERLGAQPRRTSYSGIGGSIPQVLVAETMEAIAAGQLELALVVGGEALATRRRLSKEGRKPDWSYRPAEKRPFPFDIPFHPAEVAHSVFEAYLTFALFDNARRGHLGVEPDAYRGRLGGILAPLTSVAAHNADAWFPIERGADEITMPTAQNRMVAYPYTKLMTAIMDVDMAAALLLASDEQADALGVPEERRVYLRGWAYAEDPPYVAQRRELWRSPAMAVASGAALAGAGAGVDDVAHFDLYSCFGSSIEFALDALGVGPDDARSVTVTGGLPYHGGPGSNYMTHSIATMAEHLRADPGSLGMVSGVGMHMTKHVYGVWSCQPGAPGPLTSADRARLQAEVDQQLDVAPIVETYDGRASVATWSALHGRDGAPESGVLVCDLPDGGRCYARMDDTGSLLAAEQHDLVGATVELESTDRGVNLAHVAGVAG
jgi:acetyl-CoA C-acetyltransferase